MFCQNCGSEVSDKAVVCVKCGCALTQNKEDALVFPWTKNQMITYGIIGFIIPIIGIIMGIIGLCKEPRRTQGVILLAIGLFAWFFWMGFIKAL